LKGNAGELVPWTVSQSAYNPAQEGSRALVFDLSPGAGAPPDTLGGFLMTPFPEDTRPLSEDVNDVPSPCPTGGDIVFSTPMSHRQIGSGWASWSHGYTGDVYYTNGATSVTITLPQPACAFYFYVEPNPFAVHYFTAVGDDGTSSGSFSADGEGGAAYVGIFGAGLESVTISTDDGVTDFAIGEFGIACFCEPVYVACCDEASGDCVDGVDLLECIDQGGRWDIDVYFCVDLDPPCGSQIGACCCGPENEPGVCEAYECIADMTNAACLAAGEETFWNPDESCDASPPYDCGAPTYCDGSGGAMDEFIVNVYMVHEEGTIDNDSAQEEYGDFTDIVATVTHGSSYDITVTNGWYFSSDVTAVWIDWNNDKDWDDDGEVQMMYDPGGEVASGTIVVPAGAVSGYTRMRIRIDYANPTPSPCGTTTYGEVEDYTVFIGEAQGACCIADPPYCLEDVLETACDGYFLGHGEPCDPNDCNENGVPDTCDVASGASADCQEDGIPDECQLDPDCQPDGIPDECQLEDNDCNEKTLVSAAITP
jgi:hypothetical protein